MSEGRNVPKATAAQLKEIWALIHRIESGEVKLTSEEEPQYVYAGNVAYKSSDGWEVVVFNDCNEWDYFHSFRSPNGWQIDFDQMPDALSFGHRPISEVAWSAYGIPGYLKHRDETWAGFRPKREARRG